MLLIVAVAIGVAWAIVALVMVGLCTSAARADDTQRASLRPAAGARSRSQLRLIA